MKKLLAFLFTLVLLGLSSTVPALGAVKEGSKCTKVGKTQKVLGKKFVCTQSGKNAIWKKSGKSAPQDSAEEILLSPLYTALKIDVLKTRQNDFSFVPTPGANSTKTTGCTLKGKSLFGKVAFTTDLNKATFKVFNTFRSSQSDLNVVFVSSGEARSCGLWQLVNSWDNPDIYLALVSDVKYSDFSFYNGY